MAVLIGGNGDGNEITEGQGTPTAPVGVGALFERGRDRGCFDLGLLVRCNQEDSAPQRIEAVDARLTPLGAHSVLLAPFPLPPSGRGQVAAAEEYGDVGVADLPDAELVPVPYVTAPNSIEGIICDRFEDCDYWIAVARCESTLQPQVVGYAGQYVGLFQVWLGHGYPYDWLRDPFNNTLAAWELSREGTVTSLWPYCRYQ